MTRKVALIASGIPTDATIAAISAFDAGPGGIFLMSMPRWASLARVLAQELQLMLKHKNYVRNRHFSLFKFEKFDYHNFLL